MKIKEILLTALNGFLIGIANIIPGVSGGTFALILGIFDRMILAINSISKNTIKTIFMLLVKGFSKSSRQAFAEEFKKIDGFFLLVLLMGAVVSAVGFAFIIEYLLVNKTSLTLAFFIGLIIPSIAVPAKMIKTRSYWLLLIIPGIALTAGISFIMPDNNAGITNPVIAALSGAVAVSAMILPGISGSFVLLILGQYQNFISMATGFISALGKGEIDYEALYWLVGFTLGLAFGLIAFSKLLAFLLNKAREATGAFLIGLILGSLVIMWPFKNLDEAATITGRDGTVKQDVQIATASNRLPTGQEAGFGALAFIVGAAGSLVMIRLGKNTDS